MVIGVLLCLATQLINVVVDAVTTKAKPEDCNNGMRIELTSTLQLYIYSFTGFIFNLLAPQ